MRKTIRCGECEVACHGEDTFVNHVYKQHPDIARRMINARLTHGVDAIEYEVIHDA